MTDEQAKIANEIKDSLPIDKWHLVNTIADMPREYVSRNDVLEEAAAHFETFHNSVEMSPNSIAYEIRALKHSDTPKENK